MSMIYKPLNIDPSIRLRLDLQELVDMLKISIQSHSEGCDVIMMNMYQVMLDFFNQDIIEEVMSSSIEESRYIKLKRMKGLETLLKNDDDDEEEKS